MIARIQMKKPGIAAEPLISRLGDGPIFTTRMTRHHHQIIDLMQVMYINLETIALFSASSTPTASPLAICISGHL
jgi:hypothetical protein